MNQYMIGAVLALTLLGSTFGAGWHYGRQALEATQQKALLEAKEANEVLVQALAISEQNRRQLSQSLEDQANAEPVSAPTCLPASRVLRLNQYHSSDRPLQLPRAAP